MKLISEEILPEEIEVLNETAPDGKKFLYITGPFMKSEVVNGNKRMYPREIMEREVNRYNDVYIKQSRAFGELQHPESPRINLQNVSHLTTELKRDGNDFIGKARILDTPNGMIVQKIMEGGGKLGVSSRGVGTLIEKNGVNIVQKDFTLATAADIVFDPSAPGAFVTGLMEEHEWVFENGIWKEEELMRAKKAIHEVNRSDLEAKMIESFSLFMSKL